MRLRFGISDIVSHAFRYSNNNINLVLHVISDKKRKKKNCPRCHLNDEDEIYFMLCCPCVTLLRLYLAIKRLVYAKTSPYLYHISSLKYVANPFERISRLSQINYLYSYSDSLSRQLIVLWLKPVRIPGPRLAISAIKLETFFQSESESKRAGGTQANNGRKPSFLQEM